MLSGKVEEMEAIKYLATVAFCGMAQLAELTYQFDCGPVGYKNNAVARNIKKFQDMLFLELQKANTARTGKVQLIKLHPIPLPLCLVKALKRQLHTFKKDTNSLFGFNGKLGRVSLTKRRVNKVFNEPHNLLRKTRGTMTEVHRCNII